MRIGKGISIFWLACPAFAGIINVQMTLTGFSGASAELAFDFTDGGLPSNSMLVSSFASNGTFSFRYTGPNENFVLVSRESGGSLQADSAEKLVEIIGDALVEPVQCASFLFG